MPKMNSKPSKNPCKMIPKLKSVKKYKIYPIFTLKCEENKELILAQSSETNSTKL